MQDKFLGDSYDIVKRFLRDSLKSVAPLYAHPTFVPKEIRTKYKKLTKLPIFDEENPPNEDYGLFFDPDTGIPLPNAIGQKTSREHASLNFIIEISKELSPKYMICFDQSHHRVADLAKDKQRADKMAKLEEAGIHCFYYVSHACFLFMSKEQQTVDELRQQLIAQGIPPTRIEPETEQS